MITHPLVIVLGIALLGLYLYRRFNRQHQGSRLSPGLFAEKSSGRVDRQTHNKLMRLLGGNRKTIDRLVNQAKIKNPHKSEQWYWEKVLYDLERDRWR